ncbi:MAG: hypothetical protein KHY83_05650 [Coriobacteriia bacterium]|nr:hypothetical protein [Coriobacteriia bacterium]MBS5478132.1 hypothetical protein [Coriobacteriia bacterium]
MIIHAKRRAIGALACGVVLAGSLGIYAMGSDVALGSEQAASSTDGQAASSAAADNPYLNVTPTTYGDEELAKTLIASGATFADLDEAGINVLLDEGGKLVYDPHRGHYDFECTDCHREAATGDAASDSAAGDATDVKPVFMCNVCHRITVPEGWENPEKGDKKPQYVDPSVIYGDLGYGTSGRSYGFPYGSAVADSAK